MHFALFPSVPQGSFKAEEAPGAPTLTLGAAVAPVRAQQGPAEKAPLGDAQGVSGRRRGCPPKLWGRRRDSPNSTYFQLQRASSTIACPL